MEIKTYHIHNGCHNCKFSNVEYSNLAMQFTVCKHPLLDEDDVMIVELYGHCENWQNVIFKDE